MVIDYRRTKEKAHLRLNIHGEAVERVEKLKLLGVNMSKQLTWTSNT